MKTLKYFVMAAIVAVSGLILSSCSNDTETFSLEFWGLDTLPEDEAAFIRTTLTATFTFDCSDQSTLDEGLETYSEQVNAQFATIKEKYPDIENCTTAGYHIVGTGYFAYKSPAFTFCHFYHPSSED